MVYVRKLRNNPQAEPLSCQRVILLRGEMRTVPLAGLSRSDRMHTLVDTGPQSINQSIAVAALALACVCVGALLLLAQACLIMQGIHVACPSAAHRWPDRRCSLPL